jgi:hypothetical protein
MTFDVVFEHDPPLNGRRVCLTSVGHCQTPEDAEAKVRAEFPGVVRIKRVGRTPSSQQRAQRSLPPELRSGG